MWWCGTGGRCRSMMQAQGQEAGAGAGDKGSRCMSRARDMDGEGVECSRGKIMRSSVAFLILKN